MSDPSTHRRRRAPPARSRRPAPTCWRRPCSACCSCSSVASRSGFSLAAVGGRTPDAPPRTPVRRAPRRRRRRLGSGHRRARRGGGPGERRRLLGHDRGHRRRRHRQLDQHQVRLGRPVVGAEGADVRRVLGRPTRSSTPGRSSAGSTATRASDPCVRMPPGRRLLGLLPRQARWQLGLQLERCRAATTPPPARSSASGSARASSPASLPRRPPRPARRPRRRPTPKPKPKPTTAAPKPTTPKATTPKATSGSSPVGPGRQPRRRRAPAKGHGARRHALGERHGIRLGEPVPERDGHVVGEPERDGIRPRGRADVRRRRRRRRPGHPHRRCRPRGRWSPVAPAGPPGNDAPDAMMVR